jgi:hypothetical protein
VDEIKNKDNINDENKRDDLPRYIKPIQPYKPSLSIFNSIEDLHPSFKPIIDPISNFLSKGHSFDELYQAKCVFF